MTPNLPFQNSPHQKLPGSARRTQMPVLEGNLPMRLGRRCPHAHRDSSQTSQHPNPGCGGRRILVPKCARDRDQRKPPALGLWRYTNGLLPLLGHNPAYARGRLGPPQVGPTSHNNRYLSTSAPRRLVLHPSAESLLSSPLGRGTRRGAPYSLEPLRPHCRTPAGGSRCETLRRKAALLAPATRRRPTRRWIRSLVERRCFSCASFQDSLTAGRS